MAAQAVLGLDRGRRLVPLGADPVEQEVHGAEPGHSVHDLDPSQGVGA
jgi:hypothetical protein